MMPGITISSANLSFLASFKSKDFDKYIAKTPDCMFLLYLLTFQKPKNFRLPYVYLHES